VFLLVPAYPGCPGPKAVKRWCVCVSVFGVMVGLQRTDGVMGRSHIRCALLRCAGKTHLVASCSFAGAVCMCEQPINVRVRV